MHASSPIRWLILAAALPLAAQVSVLTYQYDNSRAGRNLREITLTSGNVNASQFGRLFSYPVDGLVYGQPLYLFNLNIPGKGVHNVVYVVTEHDSIYAFDADSNTGANSTPLWQVSFLNTGAGVTTVPAADVGCDQISPEIGITSTPVIDPESGTIYLVAMTKEVSGSATTYVHRLHALDVATGAERPGSPVVAQATYPGTGEGGTTLVFRARSYKQRPGLLLLNGVIYTAWSSHCDIGPYHGWLIAYDARTLQQVAVYNNTPNGVEGSFWAGGAAPAADAAGNIYVVAGNGTFDQASPVPDLGESYIKLSTASGLSVADYFAPFNFDQLNRDDVDVGSAGVALLPDETGSALHPHLLVGAGKEGRIYLLDRDNLGKVRAGADSQIVQSISGATGGVFGNPAYHNNTVYFCGSNDAMKAFPISQGRLASASSQSPTIFNFPACVPTISASGASSPGVVWIIAIAGALHAYDSNNLANELYHSNQNLARDALGAAVKFSVPTVANGKVYAGTQNSLAVYGLLHGAVSLAANAASGDAAAVVPGSLVSLFGSGLAQSIAQAGSFPLPTALGGASVTVGGVTAPLLYAGPTQINFQVPFEIPAGSATVSVSVGGTPAATRSIAVRGAAPGIFLLDQGHAAALNQDFSVNGPGRPAAPGSVLQVFLTGLGAVDHPVPNGAAAPADPLSRVPGVTASIAGQPASLLFAGLAPGFAGLYQVNVVVPQIAPGGYPLQISAGGAASNTATVNIR